MGYAWVRQQVAAGVRAEQVLAKVVLELEPLLVQVQGLGLDSTGVVAGRSSHQAVAVLQGHRKQLGGQHD